MRERRLSAFYRARYYKQSLGRFFSRDPIFSLSSLYAYCNNSPTNFTDPFGMAYGQAQCGTFNARIGGGGAGTNPFSYWYRPPDTLLCPPCAGDDGNDENSDKDETVSITANKNTSANTKEIDHTSFYGFYRNEQDEKAGQARLEIFDLS